MEINMNDVFLNQFEIVNPVTNESKTVYYFFPEFASTEQQSHYEWCLENDEVPF